MKQSERDSLPAESCIFCDFARKNPESRVVFEDEISLAFLDHRPLFVGHCLLIPKAHYETLADLPEGLVAPFFRNVRLLAKAVEEGLHADGSFVAINNKVSQSVPHLHVHIVPRRKGDSLKGFFWPRQKYKDEAQLLATQQALRSAIAELLKRGSVSWEAVRG